MDLTNLVVLALGSAAVAALYSSVGHAGASGYLAVMALTGLAPQIMRPTALVLNIVVALLGTWRYARAGLTSWRALVPLVAASVPMAFIGGSTQLSLAGYRKLVGLLSGLTGTGGGLFLSPWLLLAGSAPIRPCRRACPGSWRPWSWEASSGRDWEPGSCRHARRSRCWSSCCSSPA